MHSLAYTKYKLKANFPNDFQVSERYYLMRSLHLYGRSRRGLHSYWSNIVFISRLVPEIERSKHSGASVVS